MEENPQILAEIFARMEIYSRNHKQNFLPDDQHAYAGQRIAAADQTAGHDFTSPLVYKTTTNLLCKINMLLP